VQYALVDVAVDGLSDGNIIRMSDLGSPRIILNSEGKTNAEEVNSASIRKANIILTPGTRDVKNKRDYFDITRLLK
jgi:hypothetical protein